MDRDMTAAGDREFAHWHRIASEALISASTQDERVFEQLDAAQNYGKRALMAASNARERMLAMGLIMTTCGIRVLHETGMETAVVATSADALDK